MERIRVLLAGGLGQQGMGSAAGAVAGYGGRLCGQGAAEYAAGRARAAVINDRELRSECGEQNQGIAKSAGYGYLLAGEALLLALVQLA